MKSFKDRYPGFNSKSMKSTVTKSKSKVDIPIPILDLIPRPKKDYYEYKIGYRGEWLLYKNGDVFKAFSSESDVIEFCDKLNILAIKA